MSNIVEVLRMRTLAGVTAQQAIDAAASAYSLLGRLPGVRQRLLAGPDADGFWTEICESDGSESMEAQQPRGGDGEPARFLALFEAATLQRSRLALRTGFTRRS